MTRNHLQSQSTHLLKKTLRIDVNVAKINQSIYFTFCIVNSF